MNTDRPTTPNDACEHKIADHYHGTYVCYTVDYCRCRPCRKAKSRYEKGRRGPRLVNAAPVKAHALKLMEQGMGFKRIAHHAGVSPSALGNIIWGRGGKEARAATKMRPATANKILSVTLDLADGAKVDATEAWQIVDELVARGWSKAAIGRRTTGPQAKALQMAEDLVSAGTLRILRTLLNERVPDRVHNPTGRRYTPDTGHRWRQIPATTPGVPDDFTPGSPTWIRVMRQGLRTALEDARRRHAA